MLHSYRDNLTGIVHTVKVPDTVPEQVEPPEPTPSLEERVEVLEETVDVIFGGGE